MRRDTLMTQKQLVRMIVSDVTDSVTVRLWRHAASLFRTF
jgi:hypothetical protein